MGRATMFGNAAAILSASKSVLFSTLKNGNLPSKDAITYDNDITPMPATTTNHKEPNFSGVTADDIVEYTRGRISRLKFIFEIAFIAYCGKIGIGLGRIALA